MEKPDQDICPHCHNQYKTISTLQDSREVLCYYCQRKGDSQRIEFPKCGGDRRFCEWDVHSRIPLR